MYQTFDNYLTLGTHDYQEPFFLECYGLKGSFHHRNGKKPGKPKNGAGMGDTQK